MLLVSVAIIAVAILSASRPKTPGPLGFLRMIGERAVVKRIEVIAGRTVDCVFESTLPKPRQALDAAAPDACSAEAVGSRQIRTNSAASTSHVSAPSSATGMGKRPVWSDSMGSHETMNAP